MKCENLRDFFTVNGKRYRIRNVDEHDRAWLIKLHGSAAKAHAIFNQPNFPAISQFVFHQLSEIDQADFKKHTPWHRRLFKNKILAESESIFDLLTYVEAEDMLLALTQAIIRGTPSAALATNKAISALHNSQSEPELYV